MKDKIEAILNELYENVQDGEYWDKTMNEITALMCYREVSAYYSCFNNYCEEDEWSSIEEDIIGLLVDNYPEQTIQHSIEKVKTEQK